MATRVHFTDNALMSPRIYHYTSRRCGHLVTVGSGLAGLGFSARAVLNASRRTIGESNAHDAATPMLVGVVLATLLGVAD